MKKIIMMVLLVAGLGACSSATTEIDEKKVERKTNDEKIVIAHRGASGYLPENTKESKVMAYAMGADYLEQDVVMTKDDRLVVIHDNYLDELTNVAEIYPERKREDGRYYVIDFTLEEIKGLKMTELFKTIDGKEVAVFPTRFPLWKSNFEISTLEEEIELIQGMNKSTGKNVGIYTEIKVPKFHRDEGKDISSAILKVLKEYGYTDKDDMVYLQCFDQDELKHIKEELMPKFDMDLKIIQLGSGILETSTIEEISQYADGIGPSMYAIVDENSTKDNLIITNVVKEAHEENMKVHPFTFRLDEGKIPDYAENFDDLLDIFYNKANVDGVFTDYPDIAVDFLNK